MVNRPTPLDGKARHNKTQQNAAVGPLEIACHVSTVHNQMQRWLVRHHSRG